MDERATVFIFDAEVLPSSSWPYRHRQAGRQAGVSPETEKKQRCEFKEKENHTPEEAEEGRRGGSTTTTRARSQIGRKGERKRLDTKRKKGRFFP